MRRRLPVVVLYGGLGLVSVAWLIPLVTALMIALRPLAEVRGGWWNLAGATFGLGNFVRAWQQGLSDFVLNSFIITIGAVALTVTTGVLAAYAFVRLQFRFKQVTYFLLVSTMIVPLQLILIPLLPWFRTLGLATMRKGQRCSPRQHIYSGDVQ